MLISTVDIVQYHISPLIKWGFPLPKQAPKSRSVLKDGSRFLRLFKKGKTRIIATFHD